MTLSEEAKKPAEDTAAQNAVIAYLKERNLSFFHTSHDQAYTAQHAAAQAHVPGSEFGKAVMVRLDDKDVVMCVLRAPDRVKLAPFAKAVGASKAELCTNQEVKAMSEHGMEAGAIPPLPALLGGMKMYMDNELARNQLIHFSGGSHHEVVTMYMEDFLNLTKPVKLDLAEPIDIHMRELIKLLGACKLGVPHGIIRHKPAYTASGTAKEAAVPGLAMIKTVVVKLDGKFAICACSSTDIIDLDKLATLANASKVELATEDELRQNFQTMEVGALPPFGVLFGLPLYLDEGVGSWPVKGDGDVVFNAGTHTELMIMRYSDYLKVNQKWNEPIIGRFATLDTAAKHPWTSAQFKRYLHGIDVPFTTLMHSVAYTASDIAHAAGISGNRLAKTVMVKVDGKLAMSTLRAADFVDLEKLSALAGGKPVILADEAEFAHLFEHVEPGAVPPMGHLYSMTTFADAKLAANDSIYMNAGTHKELLCLKWSDYMSVVNPVVGDFSRGIIEAPPSSISDS